MRLAHVLSIPALLLAGVASRAGAETAGLTMDHSGISCLVAGKHPVIAARVAPLEQVARARVYFRGGGQTRWYYVEMAAAGGVFRGTLPKPTLRLKTVEYYVDGLGRTLAEARSANHAPRVVPDEASCRGEALLLLTDEARVVVGGAPDGAPVPDGFSAEGVVGAAAAIASSKDGGVSGKTVGLGLAGLGAVGGAIAIAGGGGSSDSPAATPPSSPGGTSATPTTSAPGGTTTATFAGTLFGPGWHRGDCTRPEDFGAQFTTRSSGRADLTLTFAPRVEHFLSLSLSPQASVTSGNPQGPGPTVTASYQVQAATRYTVAVCVPVGPPLDPGPMAVTLTIAYP